MTLEEATPAAGPELPRTADLSPVPVDKHVCLLAMALASACHDRYSGGLLEKEAIVTRVRPPDDTGMRSA